MSESPYAIGHLYRSDGVHQVMFLRNDDGSYSTRQDLTMRNGDFLEVGSMRMTWEDEELKIHLEGDGTQGHG